MARSPQEHCPQNSPESHEADPELIDIVRRHAKHVAVREGVSSRMAGDGVRHTYLYGHHPSDRTTAELVDVAAIHQEPWRISQGEQVKFAYIEPSSKDPYPIEELHISLPLESTDRSFDAVYTILCRTMPDGTADSIGYRELVHYDSEMTEINSLTSTQIDDNIRPLSMHDIALLETILQDYFNTASRQ